MQKYAGAFFIFNYCYNNTSNKKWFMKINIFLFEVKNDISEKNKKLLKKVVLKHAKIATKKLSIDLINIVIYPNRDLTIQKIGAGGFAPNSEWIRLAIDPFYKEEDIEYIIKNIIPLSVYHEMNHAARWNKPGYGNTLLDAIISEGLAIVFAEENWNSFEAPWGKYKQEEIKKYLEFLNKRNKDQDKNYNHTEWFFGKGKPKWLGYKLGSFIVRVVKNKNLDINSLALVHMDSKKIIKLSGMRI